MDGGFTTHALPLPLSESDEALPLLQALSESDGGFTIRAIHPLSESTGGLTPSAITPWVRVMDSITLTHWRPYFFCNHPLGESDGGVTTLATPFLLSESDGGLTSLAIPSPLE